MILPEAAGESEYLYPNLAGHLQPILASTDQIPAYNLIILSYVMEVLKERIDDNLVSVYFRGSRLLNVRKSDFDIVVVLQNEQNIDLAKVLYSSLSHRFLSICYFDVLTVTEDRIRLDKSLRFILKIYSIHIFGKKLHDNIEEFSINADLIFILPKMNARIQMVKRNLNMQMTSVDRRRLVNYVIKTLLRACYELIMIRESRYTRNVYNCRDRFLFYFPEFETMINQIMRSYDNRDEKIDYDVFFLNVEFISCFLQVEFKKTYDIDI